MFVGLFYSKRSRARAFKGVLVGFKYSRASGPQKCPPWQTPRFLVGFQKAPVVGESRYKDCLRYSPLGVFVGDFLSTLSTTNTAKRRPKRFTPSAFWAKGSTAKSHFQPRRPPLKRHFLSAKMVEVGERPFAQTDFRLLGCKQKPRNNKTYSPQGALGRPKIKHHLKQNQVRSSSKL